MFCLRGLIASRIAIENYSFNVVCIDLTFIKIVTSFLTSITIESVYIKREEVCQIQVGLDARVDIFSWHFSKLVLFPL